jgi:hypothetical protein
VVGNAREGDLTRRESRRREEEKANRNDKYPKKGKRGKRRSMEVAKRTNW